MNLIAQYINEVASSIEDKIYNYILAKPLYERYNLLLAIRLHALSNGHPQDSIIVAKQMVKCVFDYGKGNINNPDNFVGIQINKLICSSDDELLMFSKNINTANLKKIIVEEKIVDIADHDLDGRNFTENFCPICDNNIFELVKNDVSEYMACTNCWMIILTDIAE